MALPVSTKGVLGQFSVPDDALAAARKLRDAGYLHFDVLTPFPVHGMDEAMGLKRSWVPWATAALALFGIALAQFFLNWIMVYNWPMNFGGKPNFAWPSWIPITFETMVFFGAIGSAVIAIWAGKKDNIPQPPPLLVKTGATLDKFVVWISATDPKFEPRAAEAFVKGLGAHGVRLVDVTEGSHAA